MKRRNERTHQSGFSNRHQMRGLSPIETVFERSCKKTNCFKFKSATTNQFEDPQAQRNKSPFLGTHNELETTRFNWNKMKPYTYSEMAIPKGPKILTFDDMLNQSAKSIRAEFEEKTINMHKLWQLKHTFIKNNKNRRNMKEYFDSYTKNGLSINIEGLKKIVTEYGYDINNDEARLIMRLANRHHSSQNERQQQSLNIQGFVQLMTKQDAHFKTLRVGNNVKSFQKPPKIFSDRIHQILRNKFPKLKEALEVYTKRNQTIGVKEYKKIMKKLDLNDLVISEAERRQLFQTYSSDGKLNSEALQCAIIEDQLNRVVKLDKHFDFLGNVHANQQQEDRMAKKVRKYSLKDLSFLQYEKQLFKAQQVLQGLRDLSKHKKDFIKQISTKEYITRNDLKTQTENIFKEQGINFTHEHYDAYLAYFDFDSNGSLTTNSLKNTILYEDEKDARERFERKTRKQAPKESYSQQKCNEEAAIKCLDKVKEVQMNLQSHEMFKSIDKDKDGYLSRNQLKSAMDKMNFDSKQTQNLMAYLDPEAKGSINFPTFMSKTHRKQQLPFVKRKHSLVKKDWSSMKKHQIKQLNTTMTFRNTKFSAWPYERRNSDMSLIQPVPSSALHASERDRFEESRDFYGMKEKIKVNNVAEGRLKRKKNWNSVLEERNVDLEKKEEDRLAANNFFLRLTKQNYEERCRR